MSSTSLSPHTVSVALPFRGLGLMKIKTSLNIKYLYKAQSDSPTPQPGRAPATPSILLVLTLSDNGTRPELVTHVIHRANTEQTQRQEHGDEAINSFEWKTLSGATGGQAFPLVSAAGGAADARISASQRRHCSFSNTYHKAP